MKNIMAVKYEKTALHECYTDSSHLVTDDTMDKPQRYLSLDFNVPKAEHIYTAVTLSHFWLLAISSPLWPFTTSHSHMTRIFEGFFS